MICEADIIPLNHIPFREFLVTYKLIIRKNGFSTLVATSLSVREQPFAGEQLRTVHNISVTLS